MSITSIRQDVSADFLPDFRNLGVVARTLVGVNALAFGAALLSSRDLTQAAERFMQSAVVIEPLLIATMIGLFALSALLARLPYLAGCAAVIALVLALAFAVHAALLWLVGEPPADLARTLALSALAAVCLLAYFRLLIRAYSPALAEARLQALQARIRPHFLFNSLNAVLSLIRRDPRGAERALEDLAVLCRTLMADARRFVRLADEIALLERYAEIEQLRLTSSVAATGCSRASRIRASRSRASMPATAWRWTISASAWRCSSTPRRASRPARAAAATASRSRCRTGRMRARKPARRRHDGAAGVHRR